MTDATATRTTTWTIDPNHSTVEFRVKHMKFTTVRGRFTAFDGTIEFDPENVAAATVNVEIDLASLTTGAPDRDAHLRGADFFDAETWPTMAFRSTRVEGTPDDMTVHGDLTIRDVTREVALKAEFRGTGTNPYGQTVAGFEATAEIDRRDYGLTWNAPIEAGGVLVSNDVRIQLDIQASQ